MCARPLALCRSHRFSRRRSRGRAHPALLFSSLLLDGWFDFAYRFSCAPGREAQFCSVPVGFYVPAHGGGVRPFEVTICDLKDRTRRSPHSTVASRKKTFRRISLSTAPESSHHFSCRLCRLWPKLAGQIVTGTERHVKLRPRDPLWSGFCANVRPALSYCTENHFARKTIILRACAVCV